MKKETRFTTKNKTDVLIKPITSKTSSESQLVYNKAFSNALKEGSLLKSRLESYMKEQGMWNEEKEKEYKDLIETMSELEKQLNSGLNENGDKLKLSEAKEKAIKLSSTRNDLASLLRERSSLDSSTAESMADNARFNYLLVMSCYDYKTQKRLFESVDAYMDQGDDEMAIEVATKFAELFYNIEADHEKKLTEFKFLKRFNFIDDDGFFIDKDGNKVNIKGEPIKEEPENKTDVETAEFEDDINKTPTVKKTRKKPDKE
jgi:hypothetical protein